MKKFVVKVELNLNKNEKTGVQDFMKRTGQCHQEIKKCVMKTKKNILINQNLNEALFFLNSDSIKDKSKLGTKKRLDPQIRPIESKVKPHSNKFFHRPEPFMKAIINTLDEFHNSYWPVPLSS